MIKHSMKAVAVATVVGGMIAGAVSASAALNLPTQNCAFKFNTNMKLGSRGADVTNLQKVLNMFPQTQVAKSGTGAPGMESTYFGAGTRAAVNKFQALHLVELGLSAPTGNVFAGTRALLNQVCNGTVTTNPGTNPGTVVTGPVSAALASSQPTGMIVAGQSGARLADFTFSGNGTVTSVQLQRTGVSADTTLNNVYLYDGNTRITDAASVVTGGYINFNAPAGLFTVSGSRTITVRADVASNTSGQSVGVKLNAVTAGGAASTYSNVMGNALQIASVSTAAVNFATLSNSALTPDAGTANYTVWSGSATVSTRSVNFKAATFKFVGSAPVDAIQNLNLYIDGSKVAGPVAINAANNNKVTFDLGATPYLLTTGAHTFDVRGDIVKGSYRTATFSVENVSDLMFEDSNLAGVNVSATINNATFTQSGATYGTITVNKGSVTATADTTFTANKVTGGATNVPIGQFTMKAYGEDVKVSTLRVAVATTTNASLTTLNNVSLYVNGGQIGTSQNYTVVTQQTGYLTYTLGSSLIIPAGQTVTLTVKADIVDVNSAAYTSGTIATTLSGATGNAQGQSSYELVNVANGGVTSNVLTVSSGAGSFARTSGFQGITVAPNTANVKIASFTLQANSAEAIKVNSIGVKPTVANVSPSGSLANWSTLTLKNGSTVLGTPVGNPQAGTTTFSFNEITIPANGSVTFDVYADVGGDSDATITADMEVTSRGVVSNLSTVSSAAGVTITSAASSLAASSLQSSSPVAQFVVGGSTFGIATFNVKTVTAGTQATITEMDFATTGADAIESITVGGVTKAVAGSGATATTTITGLNIVAGSNGTDVPVTVKFAGFQPASTNGLLNSVATVKVTLSRVQASSGNGSAIYSYTQVPSNTMSLVSSKPTVTVASGAGSSQIILGAENKIGEFTVTADAAGKIGVASTSITLATQGITNPEFTAFRVADGNTTIAGLTYTGTSTGTTMGISFTNGSNPQSYQISAGQSKTFSVYANVAGAQTSNTLVPYVTSRLASDTSLFKWIDINGGNSAQNAAAIYNFPTSSFVTSH